jgi:alanyl-tRNA synthetase
VLADHARAVAFLLADGVFPSNEGARLRPAAHLRRAVRHATCSAAPRSRTLHLVVQA